MLEVAGLKKSFGSIIVADDLDLVVAPGEAVGIIVPNGAGKTTLFNLITGDLLPDAGSIRLFGEEVSRYRTHRRTQRGLARTYQIITLFPRDTLEHNIVLALLGLKRTRWDIWSTLTDHADLHAQAREVLEQVGLTSLAARPVSELAYGEKRRAEIAMALAQKPRLLLLDEPLAGLSREERIGVSRLVAAIPREVTVIMIEHDMDIALELADQITLLHYGKVIVEGPREQVVADPKTREAYLGE